jgi:hypothetical protein
MGGGDSAILSILLFLETSDRTPPRPHTPGTSTGAGIIGSSWGNPKTRAFGRRKPLTGTTERGPQCVLGRLRRPCLGVWGFSPRYLAWAAAQDNSRRTCIPAPHGEPGPNDAIDLPRFVIQAPQGRGFDRRR